jgi:hypothetical protein
VLCSETLIRCRNCVSYSELAFAAETESSVANWHSLPNWLPVAKQFSLLNWLPAANQFSLLQRAACSEPVLAANFYNKPPRQK